MRENIVDKISSLLINIDEQAINIYYNNQITFIDYVNDEIKKINQKNNLISNQPFELLETNHKNHSDFMYSIFLSKNAKLTYETYIWAYNAYHNRGVSFDYFYYELLAWKNSFEKFDDKKLTSIIEFYKYMISCHEYFTKEASSKYIEMPGEVAMGVYGEFINSLINSDLNEALDISRKYIKTDEDIVFFWEKIILPSLYEIGNRWEEGSLSVGEEHTATSICQRVMAEHYSKILININKNTKILVTTGPFELHEVGARMLSDMLEIRGYDVTFLSSSNNLENINNILFEEDIDYLIFSSTIVSNVPKLARLINQIRETNKDRNFKIIVGGQAFSKDKNAYKSVPSDYHIVNFETLIEILESKNHVEIK